MDNNITVIFFGNTQVNGQKTNIEFKIIANPNETVKVLLSRFFEKSGLSSNHKFYFSNKNLENYETLTLTQMGITNNSKIEVRYIELENCVVKDNTPNNIDLNKLVLNNDKTTFNKNNYDNSFNNSHNNDNTIGINNHSINFTKNDINNINNINNKINNQNPNNIIYNNNPYPSNYINNINKQIKNPYPVVNNKVQIIHNYPNYYQQNIIINHPNNKSQYISDSSSLYQIPPRPDYSQYNLSDIYSGNKNNNSPSLINPLNYDISIKFIRYSKNSIHNCEAELKGILKLCFLNEIASKIDETTLNNFLYNKSIPEIIYFILKILKNNYINYNNRNEAADIIKKVLGNDKGCNVINFSNFVNEQVNQYWLNQLQNYINPIYINEINNIKLRLGKYQKYKYMSFFETELKKSLRESAIEFLPVSLVVIDRHDFDKFDQEMANCPNKEIRLLYHGTQIEPVSCILTDIFIRSEKKGIQFGEGVYFTDSLDYCSFYGGPKNNRSNMNKIPSVGDYFTAICSVVYYDKNGFLQVYDYKTRLRPKKNQVNFAYAASTSETIYNPDFSRFVGTEYVIYDLDQICPLISVKFKREEFCVIWRDVNFSDKAVYNNQYDEKFKKYLNDRLRYINQMAKYNVYTFTDTNEALKCVDRKKYNKIILISNVGDDFGGKFFVNSARKIIGNDVIVLFNAYNTAHLNWITTEYQNAIFSNEPKFYEEYLDSFNDKNKMRGLIAKLERHYNVKFNIDNNYLFFPRYKESGYYSQLSFQIF